MANTKISEVTGVLAAADVVTPADVLLLVSDMQGDATSKKMAFDELKIFTDDGLVNSAYASIYVAGGSTAQEPDQSTATKVTGFANNGLSSNCTAAAASDKITVTESGVYYVSFQASFTADAGSTVEFAIATGEVLAATHLKCVAKISAADSETSVSCAGLLSLTATHDVEVWVTSDDATPSITPINMQLSVHRVN